MQFALSTTIKRLTTVGSLIVVGMPLAHAESLESTELQVTSSADYESTPTVGVDDLGPLVVYMRRPLLDTGFGAGKIWYQRLSESGPVGAAVQVSVGDTDDVLNDISGDFIVYTAYESPTSSTGSIMLYRISSAETLVLGSAEAVREARVDGSMVVWIQGAPGATLLMAYDLADLGSGGAASVLAGPTPAPTNVEIGSRFVVWDQLVDRQRDVVAYDLVTGQTISVAADPATEEGFPATSGSWVVWESRSSSETGARISARNLDTGELRVIADYGTINTMPSIDGNLVAFESRAAGNYDVYVHRLLEGDTFQVTTDPSDQRLNNVFGDLVAYADSRNGSSDVFVSTLAFVPDDPCANAGGDADADGVCDANDNCLGLANPEQVDADNDGFGDACDRCPLDPYNDFDGDGACAQEDNCLFVANAGQEDADGDGYGDACDTCPLDPTNDADGDGVCGPPAGSCGACAKVDLVAGRSFRPSSWLDDEEALCRPTVLGIPASLKVRSGNAGKRWAYLIFEEPNGPQLRCRYRGDGSRSAASETMTFDKCEGRGRHLAPGDGVLTESVRLHVQSGEWRGGRLEVEADLSEVGSACN